MEIKLFDKKIKRIAKKQRLKRFTFQVLVIVVLILAGAMIAISALSLMTAQSNQEIEVGINQVKNKIDELREVESKQVYLTSKLDSFEDLIKTHEKHQAVTETVFSLIPNGTTLKGFNVSEEGEINLAGTVPNFNVLTELLDKIKNSTDHRLPILKASVNRVVFSEKGGTVSFDILLTIGVKES